MIKSNLVIPSRFATETIMVSLKWFTRSLMKLDDIMLFICRSFITHNDFVSVVPLSLSQVSHGFSTKLHKTLHYQMILP